MRVAILERCQSLSTDRGKSDAFLQKQFGKIEHWREIPSHMLARVRKHNNIFTQQEWDVLSEHVGVVDHHKGVISDQLKRFHAQETPLSSKQGILGTLIERLETYREEHSLLSELYHRAVLERQSIVEKSKCQMLEMPSRDPVAMLESAAPHVRALPVAHDDKALKIETRHAVFTPIDKKSWLEYSGRVGVFRKSIKDVDQAVTQLNNGVSYGLSRIQKLIVACMSWLQSDASKKSCRFDSVLCLLEAALSAFDTIVYAPMQLHITPGKKYE